MDSQSIIEPRDDAAPADFSGAQWAWQFLRRNPQYRSQWQAFHATWLDLEAAYGRPPNRDFCAWKNDPRAWVPASHCEDSDCRVDQDKVLIECAMGARWGFHKFPPDPAEDDPVGAGRLSWRDVAQDVAVVEADDQAWLGENPGRVAIGFDLALPLREQLERTKRALQLLQRQRVQAGQIRPLSLRRLSGELGQMLRLLDAQADGLDEDRMAMIDPDWLSLLERALALRDGDYIKLPLLPP